MRADDARPNNVTATGFAYGFTVGFARDMVPSLSIAATATYLPPGIDDYTLVGGGLHLRYHPVVRAGGRLFVELNSRLFRVTDRDTDLETSLVLAGAAAGWRWRWPSGFNLALGVGIDVAVHPGDDCRACIRADHRPYAVPYADLGYAF